MDAAAAGHGAEAARANAPAVRPVGRPRSGTSNAPCSCPYETSGEALCKHSCASTTCRASKVACPCPAVSPYRQSDQETLNQHSSH
eukprot:313247-Pelagomonas_calceolata.AAC.4